MVTPMLRDLCDEARRLRDSILRRVAAIGCNLDEEQLPEAGAIVDQRVAKLLFSPDYAMARCSLELHSGESKVMTLLVLECVNAIDAKLGRPKQQMRPITRSDRLDLTKRRWAPRVVAGTDAAEVLQ
jgi:hypothetical protein